MALNIVVSDRVRFKVAGTLTDAAGAHQPWDFWLTCKRLKASELQAAWADKNQEAAAFMVDVIEDWSGVTGPANEPVPYSSAAFSELCQIPGLAVVAFQAYAAEVGAKAKN